MLSLTTSTKVSGAASRLLNFLIMSESKSEALDFMVTNCLGRFKVSGDGNVEFDVSPAAF